MTQYPQNYVVGHSTFFSCIIITPGTFGVNSKVTKMSLFIQTETSGL